jgi:hypothetical protein
MDDLFLIASIQSVAIFICHFPLFFAEKARAAMSSSEEALTGLKAEHDSLKSAHETLQST